MCLFVGCCCYCSVAFVFVWSFGRCVVCLVVVVLLLLPLCVCLFPCCVGCLVVVVVVGADVVVAVCCLLLTPDIGNGSFALCDISVQSLLNVNNTYHRNNYRKRDKITPEQTYLPKM